MQSFFEKNKFWQDADTVEVCVWHLPITIMNKENKNNSMIKLQKKTYLRAAHAAMVNHLFKMNPLPFSTMCFFKCYLNQEINYLSGPHLLF